MISKILIWCKLKKEPKFVPLHLRPWPPIFYYAVAASINKAHEGTGWPKPWKKESPWI